MMPDFIIQTDLLVSTSTRQMALFHTDLKGDAGGIIGEVDSERVGGSRCQVRGRHVEYPLATAISEASVRNGVDSNFVDGVNRTAHRAQHGYRGAAVGPKDRCRVGDGIAEGIAHLELHRNRAATLPLIHAGAVAVNGRQNARNGPTARPIRDGQFPVCEGSKVVVSRGECTYGRGDCVGTRQICRYRVAGERSGARQSSCSTQQAVTLTGYESA